MKLTGQSIVAGVLLEVTEQTFHASNPVTGEQLETSFSETSTAQLMAAVDAAERDFPAFRQCPREQRADLLAAIATRLQAVETELIGRANLETALPQARLQGELTRTVNQLQLFAEVVRSGDFLQTRIDPALPDRQPLPRPDIRMTQIPLGPVAVFGASNFPFAFSVAGGDTAAALAAGCPVICKGHPAHPGTCELAGRAIVQAVADCVLPAGIFSLLQGSRLQLGADLVLQPAIKAVAFTGSQAGGRALYNLAVTRPEPIPVFAEMGSINPIFLLPKALAAGDKQLADDYAASVNLGVGQFCTNPGILFALAGPGFEKFSRRVDQALTQAGTGVMLHAGIKRNYCGAFERMAERSGVSIMRALVAEENDCLVSPALLQTIGSHFLEDSKLSEEVFGPAAILVVCDTFGQMLDCADALPGQLTATVHATTEESAQAGELFSILEQKAGRLILNGFPTGVEVCSAMVHGGPYPASTDSRFTSVGSEAIRRFLRPLCLQNFSSELLPNELHDD